MAAAASGALVALVWNARDPWSLLTAWILAAVVVSALAASALPVRAPRITLPTPHRPRRPEDDPARRLLDGGR